MKLNTKYVSLVVVLTATGIGIAKSSSLIHRDETRKTQLSVVASHAKKLRVRVPTGAVRIFTDSKGKVTANVARSTESNPTAFQRKWLSESSVSLKQNGDLIVLEEHPYRGQGSQSARRMNLEIDLHVPADLVGDIEVTTGEATVHGRFSQLSANITTGQLDLSALDCRGQIVAGVSTGELKAHLHSVPAKGSRLSVTTGELAFTVPSGKGMDLTATVSLGDISNSLRMTRVSQSEDGLSHKLSGSVSGGGNRVDLKVGTGSIQLSSK